MGEEGGSKTEGYFPESVITIKKMGSVSSEVVIDFFTSSGL